MWFRYVLQRFGHRVELEGCHALMMNSKGVKSLPPKACLEGGMADQSQVLVCKKEPLRRCRQRHAPQRPYFF